MGSGTNARRRRRLLSPAAPSLEVAFTVNLVLDEQYGASNDESANAVAAKALVANVADVIKNKVNDDTMIGDLMTNILAKDPSTPTVVFSVDHAKSNAKLSTMVSSTLLVKPTPSPREPDEDETHLTWIIVVVAISCTILACAAAVCLLYRKRSGVGHAHGEGGGSWSTPPSNAGTEFEMAPTTSAGRSRMHRNLTRDDAVATTRSTTRGVRGARGARGARGSRGASAAAPTRQLSSLTTDELVPLLESCNFNANIVDMFVGNDITGADLAFINDASELLVLGT